ncbi:hypothetical protein [Kineococcus sp. SYSU DK005]|uniref:hypothetical protein n=1 Tax=Kineococcus sp. SYSU DK005 TaxID=3383126 RepID=UPI003D7CB961
MRRWPVLAGALLVVPVLAACGGFELPDPRGVAVQTCREMAVRQYELPGAGDYVEVPQVSVREVPVQAGEGFEVTGSAEDVQWVCTWTSARTGEGTRTEAWIDQR